MRTMMLAVLCILAAAPAMAGEKAKAPPPVLVLPVPDVDGKAYCGERCAPVPKGPVVISATSITDAPRQ